MCLGQSLVTMSVLSLSTLSFISLLICDWGMGLAMVVVLVVPYFASSSALSLPQSPEWAAIHLSSKVLRAPIWLKGWYESTYFFMLIPNHPT